MKNSKVLRVVGIIFAVAMLVFAILYYANVWQGAYPIFMLLWGVSNIIRSVELLNDKKGWAIAYLSVGVVMICSVIVFLFV